MPLVSVRKAYVVSVAVGIVLLVSAPSWTALSSREATVTAAPRTPERAAPAVSALPPKGGSLIATLRSEPRSFNPIIGRDFSSYVVSLLTHARLVRINRVTQQAEPALAERFACTPNGLTCTLVLRRGVTWSDGAPLTMADVLFSFQAAYDERTASAVADSMSPGGKPLAVASADGQTLTVTFPSPFGPGLRILDALPILPKHKLGAALAAGTLRQQWTPASNLAEITGAGPFVLNEYRPGERLVFVRNPRYWRKDAAGTTLPYLDRLTIEIVPDQNAELLRLQAGHADMTQTEIRSDDYAILKRDVAAGKLRLLDAGVAYDADAFWFNLVPKAKANDPRRAWLQSLALRQAVSLAVDRRAFVNAVFLGAGEPQWGPVTSSNSQWFAGPGTIDRHPLNLARARVLLAGLRLTDRDRDGMLEDASGVPVRFTLITQKGNTALEKGAVVIRDNLKQVGLGVDVVALEVGALVERLMKGDYDAMYYRFLSTDTDPAMMFDFWLSSGGAHVWHMEQPTPATAWERAMDAAMYRMAAERDPKVRQQLFGEAQKLLSDNLPIIYFGVPRLYVAVSTRVVGAVATPLRPSLLWNADSIGVTR